MQIFLSYASEQKLKAEAIAFAIRERGHSVFLDRDNLSGSEGYSSRIENEIKRSDMMVFLISPEAVMPGRFTMTELEFARRHWRNVSGRILPVMLSPTDMQSVPPILKAVNIYTPQGSAPAEVAAEVDDQRGLEYALGVAAKLGLLSLVAGLLTWFSYNPVDGRAWWHITLIDRHGEIAAPQNALLFAFPIAFGAWWWGLRRWWVFAIPFLTIIVCYVAITPTISRYTYWVGKGTELDPMYEFRQVTGLVAKIKQANAISVTEMKVLENATEELRDTNVKYLRASIAFVVAMTLSLGAIVGLSIVLPAFRSIFRWLAVSVIATALSIVATFIILLGNDQHTIWKGVALFTAWLVAFGSLIGYWLARGKTRVSG